MDNKTIRFEMRIDPALIVQIDGWAKKREIPRSEAVRALISRGLGMDISKGEKLILSTLSNIANELKLENTKREIDLIVKALFHGKSWAIDWEHEWVNTDDGPYKYVEETINILSMWDYLSHIYKKLPKKDREMVDGACSFMKWGKFPGFDGNNEPHFGIARFLIEDMKRFTNFDPQKINSHFPVVDNYLSMYSEFDKQHYKNRKPIGVSELITITKKFEISNN
ncbi:MAG: YfbU family protein [Parcubacteria group bacterium]|nr:YfbU family protein [Parcubacteria group bacterium]